MANNIKGTMAIPHAYGRLQFGEDLELFFRTMIGTGANPNVAAVVVIGIEPEWTNRIVEGIAKTGKPVAGFGIERHGDIKTMADGLPQGQGVRAVGQRAAARAEWISSEIWVSVKCGETDTTSGLASNPTVGNAIDKLVRHGRHHARFGETTRDHRRRDGLQGQRAATPEVGEKFMAIFNDYQKMIDDNKTDDLSGSQPTKGNIRGGLTTIEEKAFGNLQKIGKKAKYVGVLDKAESAHRPGAVVHGHLQRRGRGRDPVGRGGLRGPLLPHRPGQHHRQPHRAGDQAVGQPLTVRTMTEHIDYDCSAILRGEMTLDQSGDKLLEMLVRTCNGRLTAQEALGHEEFVLTKLYESA